MGNRRLIVDRLFASVLVVVHSMLAAFVDWEPHEEELTAALSSFPELPEPEVIPGSEGLIEVGKSVVETLTDGGVAGDLIRER